MSIQEPNRPIIPRKRPRINLSPPVVPPSLRVSDITTFLQRSARDENDAANKVRERVLSCLCRPPTEFLEHPEFGPSWQLVSTQWKVALANLASDLPPYTSTSITMKGGRSHNYDANIMYYQDTTLIGTRKIEFKYGGTSIDALPQFLSLQVKVGMFNETYDTFWYHTYLDRYLACDPELTDPKPSLETYLQCVTKTSYSVLPFFAKLKEREVFFQSEKNEVVNQSIADYLERYGSSIDLSEFSKKVVSTQSDKVYLLWSNNQFYIDRISTTEPMTFHGIRNGNVIEVQSGPTLYRLLLRWRNHKGILNPAWQISMKRETE